MDLQIKTFRIQSEADERALNEFLVGKFIRHWGTSYTPAGGGVIDAVTHALGGAATTDTATSGVWNVLLAYEIRQNTEPRQNAEPRQGRNDRNDSSHPFAPRQLPDRYKKGNAPAPAPKAREKAPVEEFTTFLWD